MRFGGVCEEEEILFIFSLIKHYCTCVHGAEAHNIRVLHRTTVGGSLLLLRRAYLYMVFFRRAVIYTDLNSFNDDDDAQRKKSPRDGNTCSLPFYVTQLRGRGRARAYLHAAGQYKQNGDNICISFAVVAVGSVGVRVCACYPRGRTGDVGNGFGDGGVP